MIILTHTNLKYLYLHLFLAGFRVLFPLLSLWNSIIRPLVYVQLALYSVIFCAYQGSLSRWSGSLVELSPDRHLPHLLDCLLCLLLLPQHHDLQVRSYYSCQTCCIYLTLIFISDSQEGEGDLDTSLRKKNVKHPTLMFFEVGRLSCFIDFFVWFFIVYDRYIYIYIYIYIR